MLRYVRKTDFLYLLLVPVVFGFGGCAQPGGQAAVEPLCQQGIEKVWSMYVAEVVLTEMKFEIEKLDTEAGFIRTRALPGAQAFEFWRKDNVGKFNFAEANLHTIRRAVEITAVEKGGELCFECVVNTQRMSLPERAVNSISQAYAMFSKSQSNLQSLRLTREQQKGMSWIDLGRDGALEARVLERLAKKIEKLKKEQQL